MGQEWYYHKFIIDSFLINESTVAGSVVADCRLEQNKVKEGRAGTPGLDPWVRSEIRNQKLVSG